MEIGEMRKNMITVKNELDFFNVLIKNILDRKKKNNRNIMDYFVQSLFMK